MKYIPTPKISEILLEEFMIPLNLSEQEVAEKTDLSLEKIHKILTDEEKITPDISIKLGKIFGTSDSFFMELQNDIDYRNLKLEKQNAKEFV